MRHEVIDAIDMSAVDAMRRSTGIVLWTHVEVSMASVAAESLLIIDPAGVQHDASTALLSKEL